MRGNTASIELNGHALRYLGQGCVSLDGNGADEWARPRPSVHARLRSRCQHSTLLRDSRANRHGWPQASRVIVLGGAR